MVMNKRFVALLLAMIVMVSGCIGQPAEQAVQMPNLPTGSAVAVNDATYQAALEIAKLPLIDENTIETTDQYTRFGDAVNTAIKILKDKTSMDIPYLDTSQAGYEKLSKFVNEWGPLVGSYNQLVMSAKNVKQNDELTINDFYKSSAIFGAEFGLIYVSVFSKVTYEGIGILYRATGMQTLAFKCGPCVAEVLSQAHWFVRTALVESSTQALHELINNLDVLQSNVTR
jgi:hypothetical protein